MGEMIITKCFQSQAPGNLETMDSVVRTAAHFALSVCG